MKSFSLCRCLCVYICLISGFFRGLFKFARLIGH